MASNTGTQRNVFDEVYHEAEHRERRSTYHRLFCEDDWVIAGEKEQELEVKITSIIEDFEKMPMKVDAKKAEVSQLNQMSYLGRRILSHPSVKAEKTKAE